MNENQIKAVIELLNTVNRLDQEFDLDENEIMVVAQMLPLAVFMGDEFTEMFVEIVDEDENPTD